MAFTSRSTTRSPSSCAWWRARSSTWPSTFVPAVPTFGKWEGVVLSAENHRQFFIPRGFAHGFYVMSETAVFCYKCDDTYHPGDEGGLMWNDPAIGIDWPLVEGVELNLSEKDTQHPSFDEWRSEKGL
ncbi:MAG: dTDP-4-dehydrorhamnose 3,5-epimerase [Atopobiaceae bacterium]|nr:dTDP-4-dehydrorhamnose 3,5-epimerase [Atopobiaceae bacterium]